MKLRVSPSQYASRGVRQTALGPAISSKSPCRAGALRMLGSRTNKGDIVVAAMASCEAATGVWEANFFKHI